MFKEMKSQNRRSFLKTVSYGVIGSAVISGHASASSQVEEPMLPVENPKTIEISEEITSLSPHYSFLTTKKSSTKKYLKAVATKKSEAHDLIDQAKDFWKDFPVKRTVDRKTNTTYISFNKEVDADKFDQRAAAKLNGLSLRGAGIVRSELQDDGITAQWTPNMHNKMLGYAAEQIDQRDSSISLSSSTINTFRTKAKEPDVIDFNGWIGTEWEILGELVQSDRHFRDESAGLGIAPKWAKKRYDIAKSEDSNGNNSERDKYFAYATHHVADPVHHKAVS